MVEDWQEIVKTRKSALQLHALLKSADDAYRIGFLKLKPELSSIYDLTVLNRLQKEKALLK